MHLFKYFLLYAPMPRSGFMCEIYSAVELYKNQLLSYYRHKLEKSLGKGKGQIPLVFYTVTPITCHHKFDVVKLIYTTNNDSLAVIPLYFIKTHCSIKTANYTHICT